MKNTEKHKEFINSLTEELVGAVIYEEGCRNDLERKNITEEERLILITDIKLNVKMIIALFSALLEYTEGRVALEKEEKFQVYLRTGKFPD